jgi:hypothetical protein
MEIVKVCKKHGELTAKECFIVTDKRYGAPKSSLSCKLCKKEHYKKSRKNPENVKKHNQNSLKWKKENKEKAEKDAIIYKFINKNKLNKQEKERRHKNPEKYQAIIRNQKRKEIKELSDSYIKAIFTDNRNGKNNLKRGDIPNDLVELKRATILLKRLIKKKIENE